MRTPSERAAGNGGYWHSIDGKELKLPKANKPERPVIINAAALWNGWLSGTTDGHVAKLASVLGVSSDSLATIGCVWIPEKNCYGFPMYNGAGKIVGIRTRTISGDYFCIKGSMNGNFLPIMQPERTAWICEGPSSTSALLTMGFYAIGRVNRCACVDMLNETIKRLGIREVVLVADDDPVETGPENGLRGMERLQDTLAVRSVIVLCCGWKDPREFLKNGGTKQMLESSVADQIWRQP